MFFHNPGQASVCRDITQQRIVLEINVIFCFRSQHIQREGFPSDANLCGGISRTSTAGGHPDSGVSDPPRGLQVCGDGCLKQLC